VHGVVTKGELRLLAKVDAVVDADPLATEV
jgi:hypothetical protein